MRTLNTDSITRRTAIGGGIVCALACVNSRRILAADMLPIASTNEHRAVDDLYAFPGRGYGGTVIALTAPENDTSEFRIHAGSRHWVFEASASNSFAFPLFVGKVATGSEAGHNRDAVVLEVPNDILGGVEHAGIWAERFTHSGERRRIGSPLLAAVLLKDEKLAREYHSIYPAQDRDVLLEGVTGAIAAEARNTAQVNDPHAYGRRLALRLLPDVLNYNPELPHGFSFAARNGRHPGDAVAAMVGTTLKGSPVSVTPASKYEITTAFPYFRAAAA